MATKRKDYISWREYFMGIAELSAQRSKDPNTQVGACIVSENNQILGIGYNGFPRGVSDDHFPWTKPEKYLYVCHAEQNAILNSVDMKRLPGSILYVTLFPCNNCAKIIIQAGIGSIVYLDDKYHDTESCVIARKMFDFVGINYVPFLKQQ